MKIQYKLLLAPAIGIILLMLFGFVSINSMRVQSKALEEIFVDRFGEFEFSAEVVRRLDANRGNVFRQFSLYESEFARFGQVDEEKAKKRNAEIIGSIEATTAMLAKRAQSAKVAEHDKQTYGAIAADLHKYDAQVAQALQMSTMDVGGAVRIMESADKAYLEVYNKLAALVKGYRGQASESYDQAQSRVGTALVAAGVILALAIFGSLGASLIMSRRIMKPLREATEGAARIANGDLTVAMESSSSDEVGIMVRSLETMRQNLKTMITSVRSSSGRVADSSTKLVAAAEHVAKASNTQSDSASATAAAVEQLTVSINHMAENASKARELSDASGEVSRMGGEVIQRTLREMKGIANIVTEASQTIEKLGQQSAQISTVVAVIKEIADQTNLLALNAAIEAARAGEQGRGFAVVADEVRKLAERTTRSTEEIRQTVGHIQEDATQAVSCMSRAVSAVDQGVELAAEAGESTDRITSHTAAVVQEVSAISDALKEQSSASNEIASRVETIVRMTEENSASARSSETSAREVQEFTGQMIREVDRFRM